MHTITIEQSANEKEIVVDKIDKVDMKQYKQQVLSFSPDE